MTHPELVSVAARWLGKKCSVVLTEIVTTGETPDAIGWQGTFSTLVECKASRSDFLADADKPFRRNPEMGLGENRYYLAPVGIIPVGMLPPKWGLLEVTDCGICVVRKSELFDANTRHALGLLLSALKRIGRNAPDGISIRCYTIPSKNTASLGIAEDSTPAADCPQPVTSPLSRDHV